jgi:hypothetical protein
MPATPLFQAGQPQRQRAGQPNLVSHLRQQRGPRVRHQPRSVRRDFYGYRASFTHHLQGEPPSSGSRTFSKPQDPRSVGRFRAPARRGRGSYCKLRVNDVAPTIEVAKKIRSALSTASSQHELEQLGDMADLLTQQMVTRSLYAETLELDSAMLSYLPEDVNERLEQFRMRATLTQFISLMELGNVPEAQSAMDVISTGGEIAVFVLDEWIANLRRPGIPDLLPKVISASFLKMLALVNDDQPDRAIAVIDATLAEFSDDTPESDRGPLNEMRRIRDELQDS